MISKTEYPDNSQTSADGHRNDQDAIVVPPHICDSASDVDDKSKSRYVETSKAKTNEAKKKENKENTSCTSSSPVVREQGDGIREIDEQPVDIRKALLVIDLFIPITICMTMVVASVRSIPYYNRLVYEEYDTYTDEGHEEVLCPVEESEEEYIELAIIIVGVVMGAVIAITFLLLALYYFRCYKFLFGYMVLASLFILFVMTGTFIEQLFVHLNTPVDIITIVFLLYNFGALGLLVIYWKGPTRLQQMYLIIISAVIALSLVRLIPPVGMWILLGLMSIWDLVAVLCPFGPLRLLVKTAQDRDEPILPALVYSSKMVWILPRTSMTAADLLLSQGKTSGYYECDEVNDIPLDEQNISINNKMSLRGSPTDSHGSSTYLPSVRSTAQTPVAKSHTGSTDSKTAAVEVGVSSEVNHISQEQTTTDSADEGECKGECEDRQKDGKKDTKKKKKIDLDQEEKDIKLGMGDFVFYSLLMAAATKYDNHWNSIISCYIAILVGLSMTIILLAVFHKPLPALPISLTFGIIFNFATSHLITPFLSPLTDELVFI